ncbi:MAG: class I SAM-dependent methyltransferase [Burkholderiaceae bacterium]|nr:class I SAM-dependent methyltransferase [Rhodoferax sp.]MCP5285578.1 class I SAM-dependent methyltransferase [Burkholderiaceae bacterium]
MTTFTDAADTWNRRFAGAGEHYLFGRAPNAWLQTHAAWPAGARVLCVADGEGRNSVWLAQQGLLVDAFDIAEVGVQKARALATDAGVAVNYSVADVDGWPWPVAHYDGVAAIFVQFADPDMRTRLFVRLQQCLKPGGVLLLQGYTPRQLEFRTGGPGQIEHLYTEALLREAFAGMDIVTLEDYEADIREGNGHHGRSALIGLVARKR